MKKIGILFGMEDTFPWAFIDKVNELGNGEFVAEPVMIHRVEQGAATDYAVIIDRISQDVPFYRAYLKNAAMNGTYIINNPFWWSADEKFFNNALMTKIGIPLPKTVILPTYERPANTQETSFRNMYFPHDWDYIFDYVGFPAFMKPHDGGGWRDVYKVHNAEELFDAHSKSHTLVMMLQENIDFEDYYRVYCLGRKYVHIMPYEPRNPHHLRYATTHKTEGEAREKLLKTIEDYTLKINRALGYDFNTVEFAVRDGIPYAIDFCNPAPDADRNSVGEENFQWIVEHAAKLAIEKAREFEPGKIKIDWGEFVRNSMKNIETTDETKAKPKPGTQKK